MAGISQTPEWTSNPRVGENATYQDAEAIQTKKNNIKVHWYHPTSMLCLWFVGVGLAIGHHFYYASLHGKPAEDQEWVIRYGTAFAFVIQASFGASLTIAVKQFSWTLVRRTWTSLRGIDAVFSITSNPASFLVGEIWRKMPTLVLVGILVWGVPLAAVVTPAAISVTSTTTTLFRDCDAPNLAFTKRYDWTYKTPQVALANFNISQDLEPAYPDGNATPWQDHTVALRKGYGGPTPFAEKLIRRVFIGGEIVPIPSICGPNCTYTVSVPGIGYQCALFDPASDGGKLLNETSDRIMWAYHALLRSSRELLVQVIQQETQKGNYVDIEYYTCNPHYAWYDLKFSYLNENRNIDIIGELFGDRIPWPLFGEEEILSATYPETNFWVYQALADLVGQHFKGTIFNPGSGAGQSSDTLLSYTTLVAQQTAVDNPNATVLESVFWPKHNFRNNMIELVRNLSISLLADPKLYIYNTKRERCEITNPISVWIYSPMPLWIAYGILIWTCSAGIALGAIAFYINGCSSDMSFSTLLCATRNNLLDRGMVGARFGAHPFSPEMEQLPLLFGELTDEKHAGFGVKGQVVPFLQGTCEKRLA